MTYDQWIAENVASSYGQCAQVTLAMSVVFPELIRTRGHYYCPVWGERSHWWLVAPDGSIIDPTKSQFPSNGDGVYVAWNESQREPTGKCLNCGEYVYNGRECCDSYCYESFRAHCIERIHKQ